MRSALPALPFIQAAVPGSAPGRAAVALPRDRLAALDLHAASVPAAEAATMERLTAYLLAPARSDAEKLRTLYRWVTLNIGYDAGAFFSGRLRSGADLERVWHRRTAVCDGFATLLHRLGMAAGLRMETLSGCAKGYGFNSGEPVLGNANHAWNAVWLDGGWHLLDATWDAGFLDPKTRRFVRAPNDDYFLAPPRRFAWDHFPEDPRWQLLPVPLSVAQFRDQVQVKPAYFRLGIELDSHRQAVIHAAHQADILLRIPPGVRLIAHLERDGRTLDRALTYVRPGRGRASVHAVFPAPGDYTLHVFGRLGCGAGTYDEVLRYTVRAARGSGRRFPGFTPEFFDLGLGLESRLDGVIGVRDVLRIRLSAPVDVRVAAALQRNGKRVPGHWALVQRAPDGGVEVRAAAPRAGEFELAIFAAAGRAAGKLPQVLSYRIIAERGAAGPAGLPESFAALEESGASLLEPLLGTLRAGSPQAFRVRAPRAAKVAAIQDGHWTFLRRNGDVFSGRLTLRAGQVSLGAQFAGRSGFDTLVRYTVEA